MFKIWFNLSIFWNFLDINNSDTKIKSNHKHTKHKVQLNYFMYQRKIKVNYNMVSYFTKILKI